MNDYKGKIITQIKIPENDKWNSNQTFGLGENGEILILINNSWKIHPYTYSCDFKNKTGPVERLILSLITDKVNSINSVNNLNSLLLPENFPDFILIDNKRYWNAHISAGYREGVLKSILTLTSAQL